MNTQDTKSKWYNILKVLQERYFKPRILYPDKITFSFAGKKDIFEVLMNSESLSFAHISNKDYWRMYFTNLK